jgi:hypothetical protein
MDIKSINNDCNPLKDKIIYSGEKPYKLWLEFEETSPCEDITNDFANIGVDTLDGRFYGINTWTFKFLQTAHQNDIKQGGNKNGLYLIPPDLLVKELSRECIENTISALLKEYELEVHLNCSVFNLKFLDPWESSSQMEDLGDKAKAEIESTLKPSHQLYGQKFDILAQRKDKDELLLELENRALVKVDLNEKAKSDLNFPTITCYHNEKDFWENCLKNDIINGK